MRRAARAAALVRPAVRRDRAFLVQILHAKSLYMDQTPIGDDAIDKAGGMAVLPKIMEQAVDVRDDSSDLLFVCLRMGKGGKAKQQEHQPELHRVQSSIFKPSISAKSFRLRVTRTIPSANACVPIKRSKLLRGMPTWAATCA